MDVVTNYTREIMSAVGVLILLLLAIYAPIAIKRRQDSISAFNLAFESILINLYKSDGVHLAQVATACHSEIIATVRRVRASTPFWRRKQFDLIVENYKSAHGELVHQEMLLILLNFQEQIKLCI